MYHKYDPQMHLNFTQQLERTQYCAALAVTGAWRGTSRECLYREFDWEDLYHRRWYRGLCHFYNLIKSRSPNHLFVEIPPERNLIATLTTGVKTKPKCTFVKGTMGQWIVELLLVCKKGGTSYVKVANVSCVYDEPVTSQRIVMPQSNVLHVKSAIMLLL